MRIEPFSARAAAIVVLLLSHGLLAGAQEPAPRGVDESAAGRESNSVFTDDHTVEAGRTVDDIVVVGGDLRVRGRITGDAVVVGGKLILEESGLVEGDAMVTGGSIVENGGRVRGEMRTLDSKGDELGREIRRAVDEGMADAHAERRPGSWLGSIRDGFLGLISALAFGLVLAGAGAVLIFYGRPYLETVSDTLRSGTLRSGAVGLAASFLVIPAFVVLVVALAVSIIGIPFLLVAVPLYPLAVAAAAGMGLLAAAHAIGERTSEQRGNGFDFRYRNSYAYLFTGLGMLLAPLLAANLIEMTGFLGLIRVLLKVATWTVIWAATTMGLGAVILSRAGSQRTFVAPPPMDADFDRDPYFDREPSTPSPHV